MILSSGLSGVLEKSRCQIGDRRGCSPGWQSADLGDATQPHLGNGDILFSNEKLEGAAALAGLSLVVTLTQSNGRRVTWDSRLIRSLIC